MNAHIIGKYGEDTGDMSSKVVEKHSGNTWDRSANFIENHSGDTGTVIGDLCTVSNWPFGECYGCGESLYIINPPSCPASCLEHEDKEERQGYNEK